MNVLVPVSFSRSIDQTVEYAVDRIHPDGGSIHLVYTEPLSGESARKCYAQYRMRQLESIARTRGGDKIEVIMVRLAQDRYLSSPDDHVAAYATYAQAHDIELVIMDPGFSVDATDPVLQPVGSAFKRIDVATEIANVRTIGIPTITEFKRFVSVGIFALAFYLVVSPSVTISNLIIGTGAALLTGALFRNVVFETTPMISRTIGVFVRGMVFIPYLLAKILVANVQISYLVLHPSLPIDPHLDRIETELSGGITVTALANSLTLTPGTLTVDAVRDELLVHSITPETRWELLTGERQRAIQFVYYGTAVGTPGERIALDRVVTEAGRTDARELVGNER